MAEGDNQQNAMPAVANNDVRNNGPTANGGTRPMVDLQDLMRPDGQPDLGHQPNVNSTAPAYTSYVKQKTVSLKLKERNPVSPGQMERWSQQFDRKMKLVTKRQIGNDHAAVVKTLTFRGCICFDAKIYLPKPTVYFEQDPLELVACLPSDLRHEKIQILTQSYKATVENMKVMRIDFYKEHGRQSNDKGGIDGKHTSRLSTIEPPCVAQGKPTQKVKIHIRNESQTPLHCVSEMENKVIDNAITQQAIHEVNVPCGTEQNSNCGSIRLMSCEEIPTVVGLGSFGKLPAQQAAELNAYYACWVQSLNQSACSLIDAREYMWSNVLQPLFHDLDFVLTIAQSFQTPSSCKEYSLATHYLLEFFKGERLQSCASFVQEYCGTVGEAVRSCMKTTTKCMDARDGSSWMRHVLKRHVFEMKSRRSRMTDNRFVPTGVLPGLSPVCW